MSLLAARGLLTPMPVAAVFADTGDEPRVVYEHLDWLRAQLPFPVLVTSAGRLSEQVALGNKEARPPLFFRNEGKKGRGQMGRQCTRNFKVRPVRREIRRFMGRGPNDYMTPESVVAWIGISTDEVVRVVPSGLRYLVNRHPLIELGWSRTDCLRWLQEQCYPRPPKSSCVYCPYKSDEQWRQLRDTDPGGWEAAVAFDHLVRQPDLVKLYGKTGYVHGSMVPLDQAPLNGVEEEKFDQACEGMCGV